MLFSLPTMPLTILFISVTLRCDKYVIVSADKAPNDIVLLLLLSFMTNMLLSLPTRPLTILFYYCSLLHDKYVIDSADKASNNIV